MSSILEFGCFVSIGGRPYLEDYLTVVLDLNKFISDVNDYTPRSFFAVFDGKNW